MKTTRRTFLTTSGRSFLALPLLSVFPRESAIISTQQQDQAPTHSTEQRIFNVKDYGAHGDGSTNDTHAIQTTINRCHVLGGGIVTIPSGTYLTGALQLRSHVTLRLEDHAVLQGTASFADYPLMQVRWEGKWIEGHIALIYAVDAVNIGIQGKGKIIGNPAVGGRPTPQYPYRHPALIEFINCTNIHLQDFSAEYTRMWCLHPTYCDNVRIERLTIRSTGGNSDGIDIDSCRNVTIEGCDIATGDDCIAIKSGRGMEGYVLARPTENVRISNCVLSDALFACIGIGSETSGGIRSIHIDHCTFHNTKTHAIYIKSRPGRGAFIEDITAEHLDVNTMGGGFLRINLLNSGLQDQNPVPGEEGIPRVQNLRFSFIHVKNVPTLVDATSIHPAKPLDGFSLSHVTGTCDKGIFLAHMKNVSLNAINVTGYRGSLLNIHNVSGEGLQGAVGLEPPVIPDPLPQPVTPFRLQ